MSRRNLYGSRYIHRSNAGIVIQKTNPTLIEQRNLFRDIVIEYAPYYEKKLLITNEYDELEANALTTRWIDDTIKYYESNFADKLDAIVSYFEKLIINEENEKRNNNIQKIKSNSYGQMI